MTSLSDKCEWMFNITWALYLSLLYMCLFLLKRDVDHIGLSTLRFIILISNQLIMWVIMFEMLLVEDLRSIVLCREFTWSLWTTSALCGFLACWCISSSRLLYVTGQQVIITLGSLKLSTHPRLELHILRIVFFGFGFGSWLYQRFPVGSKLRLGTSFQFLSLSSSESALRRALSGSRLFRFNCSRN